MEKNFFTIFLKKSNNIEEFSIFFYLKKYFYIFSFRYSIEIPYYYYIIYITSNVKELIL